MNKIIEIARQKAIKAGVPAECVNGKPCEVDSTWCGEDVRISWGCNELQACAMEQDEQAWYEQFQQIVLGDSVFTWKGLPRWTIWVSPEEEKAYSE